MNTIEFIPSPQQQALFDWVRDGRGSANVIAVAGAGKTTSILTAVQMMHGNIFVGAYNKKIAEESGLRLQAMGADMRRVRSGTMHSAGFAAWRNTAKGVRVDDKKTCGIVNDLIVAENLPKGQGIAAYADFIPKAVSLAKQSAFGLLCDYRNPVAWYGIIEHFGLDDELDAGHDIARGIQYCISVYEISLGMDKEVIDFDDMILAPLVHKARFWQQDWVLIDEAQDTNPARRALARAMLKPGGRLIAVGDPRQAIFGFTGADADSMDLIKADFNCIELPLTVSYRCPKAVVAHAQQWVSHIEAHPTALDGVVRTMPLTRLLEQAGAVHAFLDDEWPALSKDDAILCRNTKPLVELAYGLIRLGVACQVEGRDIGLGLIKLARKWRCTGLEALLGKLALYKGQECAKLAAKGKEQQAAAIEDRVETLICMAEVCQTQGKHNITDLVSFIERLFGDTKDGDRPRVLTLSTVHKSKGREWDKVYLLGRNKYMPSKWARKAWQQEQEDNLCYVAVTRAKRELIEIMVD